MVVLMEKPTAGPPLRIEDLVFETNDISTLAATYQDLLNLRVPNNEMWELWMLILCSSQSESSARFKVTFGNTAPKEFSPNVRIPIYHPLPDKLQVNSGVAIKVQVKSDGAATVRAFATLIGNKVSR